MKYRDPETGYIFQHLNDGSWEIYHSRQWMAVDFNEDGPDEVLDRLQLMKGSEL